MSDIPHFAEAVEEFRRFLSKEVHYDEVFWVFRDDVFRLSADNLRVRYPTPSVNLSLARKVFLEGRQRGLVEITAIATAARKVAATVWYPKYEHEEIQSWSQGMKLSISQPLPDAKTVGVVRWQLLNLLPSFRRYQRMAFFIGTRKWAAA
jgi:hypothetical protein